jgi:hypothetical protein
MSYLWYFYIRASIPPLQVETMLASRQTVARFWLQRHRHLIGSQS